MASRRGDAQEGLVMQKEMFWKHLANPVWIVRERAGEHKYVSVADSTLRETKKQLGFTS